MPPTAVQIGAVVGNFLKLIVFWQFSAIFSTWILKYNCPGPARADPRPSLPNTWSIVPYAKIFDLDLPRFCVWCKVQVRAHHTFIRFLKNIYNKPIFYKSRQQVLVSFWSSRLFFHLGILIHFFHPAIRVEFD